MIIRSCLSALSFCFLLLILQTLNLALPATASDGAKKNAPEITKVAFDSAPQAPPLYFDGSDVILLLTRDYTVLRSTDGGASFKPCPDVPDGVGWDVFLHPYERSTAYIWGKEGTHFVSSDAGDTWREFKVDGYPNESRPPFSFHAGDPGKIILNICQSAFLCDEISLYTLDGFEIHLCYNNPYCPTIVTSLHISFMSSPL